MTIQAIGTGPAVTYASSNANGALVGSAGVSLPPSTLGDAAAIAMFAEMSTNDTKIRGATKNIEIGEKQRQSAIRDAKEALARALEAQKKGGFWSKVGKIAAAAAVVAGAASAALTAGSGAVAGVAIAGALLSSSSVAMKALDVDAELLEVRGMQINLSDTFALGGAICTGGAGAFGTGRAVTAGARVGGLVATGAQVGATSVQAGAKYGETQALADVVDEDADATAHRNRAGAASDRADEEVGIIQQVVDDKRKAMEAIVSILNSQKAADAAVNRRLA